MVDNHKELHILCAIGLVVASAVHTAAHLAYIVPALSSSMQNLQELNNMTSCGMCALYDKSGQDVDKIKSRDAGEEGAKKAEAYLVNKCGKSAAEARSIVEPIKRGLLEGLPPVPTSGTASRKHRGGAVAGQTVETVVA